MIRLVEGCRGKELTVRDRVVGPDGILAVMAIDYPGRRLLLRRGRQLAEAPALRYGLAFREDRAQDAGGADGPR